MKNCYPLKQVITLQLIALLCCCSLTYAKKENGNPCNNSSRYLYWTGEVNNDFFNEKNWRITEEKPAAPKPANSKTDSPVKPSCLPGSNNYPYSICINEKNKEKDKYPKENTLEPGMPIAYNLLIESGNVTANGAIVIACAQKGLTLIHTKLDVVQGGLTQGVLTMSEESTVHLRTGSINSLVTLNFLDNASWVYLHQQNPDALASGLNQIMVNHIAGTPDVNFRIQQYYQSGAVIRPITADFSPLKIYPGQSLQGAAVSVKEDIIYSGSGIPEGMDKATKSFVLKRGYMASFAINENGTGKSKVYIASESDLTINTLDIALQGNIRFIRVVPWNWVTKKGTGGVYSQLDAGWYYNWNLNGNAQPNYEYVPMAWGASGTLPTAINQFLQKKKTTHILGFNESDNCSDQSGQYNNLCQPAVAVAYYENLMGLGLRLGTPAPRENGPTTWLLEFNRIAKQRDVRFDFVAVHWYDWGSNPASSPNADPQQIFNRFKSYLENVHRIYQLPIWITEFNANPNRGNAIQEAFLRLALPYLESLEYVERYAYFQPNAAYAQNPTSSANYLDNNGALTNIGELYLQHVSTPSIPEATYACPNNLEGLDQPYVAKPTKKILFEAECGKYIGNQWDILSSTDASNGLYLRGNTNNAGATSLAKQVHYEIDINSADTYRAWIRFASVGTGAIRIRLDGNDFEQITPFNSSNFIWMQVPRFYDLSVGKHRITIEFPNSNIQLDQVALTAGPESLTNTLNEPGYCTPAVVKWGLESTDYLRFYEAETAVKGIAWKTETSNNAKGGAFVSNEAGNNTTEAPTGTDQVLNFTVSIEKSDEYDIWAKIQAKATTESSLWIAVDDEPFRKWNHLSKADYAWYWKKFHYSYDTEDRSFTYFLDAGEHQVRIAIASGNVFVDRLAVATKGKLPENTDPNVLLLSESLEFEAETATILGNATIVLCNTSSNGKIVNFGNVNGNGVRFDKIVAEAAGAYKLKVSYISAVVRSFRLIVNGVILGKQTPAISGAWCFNGGSAAIYEVTVQLNRGVNTIDITPFSGDAPFIDKIKLEKAALNGLSLEAELAELLGSNTIVACNTSSNSALVNMGLSTSNGVRFNNLLSTENKKYLIDVYYISAVDRNLRLSINGQAFTTQAFPTSGAWCFNGGAPKIKTIEVDLVQGNNTIEMRPTGADAPFIDRILIREKPVVITTTNQPKETVALVMEHTTSLNADFTVYPNPVVAGTAFNITIPVTMSNKEKTMVQVTDVTGKAQFVQRVPKYIRQVQVTSGLQRGIYVVSVIQGETRISRKIIIQ